MRSWDLVILWSCDIVILWSCDLVILWSCDHVILWSCALVILWSWNLIILWSSDLVIVWSCDLVILWSCDLVIFLILWSCDLVILWSCDLKSKNNYFLSIIFLQVYKSIILSLYFSIYLCFCSSVSFYQPYNITSLSVELKSVSIYLLYNLHIFTLTQPTSWTLIHNPFSNP